MRRVDIHEKGDRPDPGDAWHRGETAHLRLAARQADEFVPQLIEAAPGPSLSLDAVRKDSVRQAVFDATRSTMETLGREISLCLRYYSVTFRGQRPGKLRLFGGEAADPLLLGVLNSALGVPVEAARPLYSIDTSRMDAGDRKGYLSEWATALGLSLKLTTTTFARRDGKPRDPNAPITPAPTAEVVDINQVVAAVSPETTATSAGDPHRASGQSKPETKQPETKHLEGTHA